MRTVRMKIITGILMCSLLTAAVIGVLAIMNSTQLAGKDSREKMQFHSMNLVISTVWRQIPLVMSWNRLVL